MAPVDRAVDQQRDMLSVSRPQSTGLVDRWPNGQKSDRWPVDRAGRPTAVQAVDLAPTASFFYAYKMGVSWTVLNKIFGEF